VIGRVTAGVGLAFGSFNRGDTVDVYVLSDRGRDRFDDPDHIFLARNDGSFTPLVLPGNGKASGDDVAELDYDDDGYSDFVVSNGDKKGTGPLQLFTWR